MDFLKMDPKEEMKNFSKYKEEIKKIDL